MNSLLIIRCFEMFFSFLSMVMSAATLDKTRTYKFSYGADIYSLLISLLSMIFLILALSKALSLDKSRIASLVYGGCELLVSILWFAAFIASAATHASCESPADDKDKSEYEKLCNVGKGTIAIVCITWVLFLSSAFILGKQLREVIKMNPRSNSSESHAEQVTGISSEDVFESKWKANQQSRGSQPPPYPRGSFDQASWVSQDSMEKQ